MKAFIKLIFILIFVVLALQIYLSTQDETSKDEAGVTKVAVSSFALYDIATHISQESIKVVNILPFGVDPHSFEPTPKLMTEIQKSDILFYSGAGLEPWIDEHSFKNRVIDVSRHVTLLELSKDEHDEHKNEEKHMDKNSHKHEHEHEACDHKGVDPHYWLDFENMQKVVALIRDEFIKLEPANRALYEQNAARYVQMLKELDKEYRVALKECRGDLVIVNHNAIGYLSHEYGFRVESLSGFSPEAQASPKDITRVFEEIKKEGVSTIFFESFVNNKTIKAVAVDANVTLEVLQPLGNITAKEAELKLTYEQIMRDNLSKLAKALECN